MTLVPLLFRRHRITVKKKKPLYQWLLCFISIVLLDSVYSIHTCKRNESLEVVTSAVSVKGGRRGRVDLCRKLFDTRFFYFNFVQTDKNDTLARISNAIPSLHPADYLPGCATGRVGVKKGQKTPIGTHCISVVHVRVHNIHVLLSFRIIPRTVGRRKKNSTSNEK